MLQVLHDMKLHTQYTTYRNVRVNVSSLKKITYTVSSIKKYGILCKTMMPRKIIHSGWCVGGSL